MAILVVNIVAIAAIIAVICVIKHEYKKANAITTSYRVVNFHTSEKMAHWEPETYGEAQRLAAFRAVDSGLFPSSKDAMEDWWLIYDIVKVIRKGGHEVDVISNAPQSRYGRSYKELFCTISKYDNIKYDPEQLKRKKR